MISIAALPCRLVIFAVALLSPLSSIAAEPVLPPSITINYRLTSSLTDGVASFVWKRDGSRYQLESSIEAKGFFSLVGALRQSSRGDIGAQGLQPAFFSIKRGDGVADTANFNRDSRELKTFARGENKVAPLPTGLQDTLSFLFQLPYDLRSLKSDGERLVVLASNARKIYRHEFVRVGEETLQTAMGEMRTVHLKSQEANPEDVYEVWLAPENFYLPVKLKFFAGRFLIEQTVSSIHIGG